MICPNCESQRLRKMIKFVRMELPNGGVHMSERRVRHCDECNETWENTRDGDWRPAYYAAMKEAKP